MFMPWDSSQSQGSESVKVESAWDEGDLLGPVVPPVVGAGRSRSGHTRKMVGQSLEGVGTRGSRVRRHVHDCLNESELVGEEQP